jgi:N-acetyl-alpha-D-glucosaminyl L-malate synthase BshA
VTEKDIVNVENSNSRKKLKIGILSFYYPHLGGSGIITSRIASQLANQGHEIHFIGYDTDCNPPFMENLGIKLHKVRKVDYPCLKNEPYIWSLASKIHEVDKEYGLDILHANYALPHAASAFLARERISMEGKYLPYVVTGHGSDIHTNGHKMEVNPILQLCLNKADALTFVSKDLKKIAEDELGILKKGIHIPNFVDKNMFYPKESKFREKLDIPQNAFVIGHVSNFAPVKQVYHFSYLAENMKVNGTLNNTYFLMVGDGRERASLEERVDKIEARENFRFTGNIPPEEVLEAYNSMDVVLLPSKHEGNPLTILESMACAKPVIGTKVGGIEETIKGGGGFLFESGDTVELNRIINVLKNNKEYCREVGQEGLEKVEKTYSVDKVINKYLDVYNSILKK